MTDLRKYLRNSAGVAARRDRNQVRARAFEEGYVAALETGEPQTVCTKGIDGEFEIHFIPAPPRGKQ